MIGVSEEPVIRPAPPPPHVLSFYTSRHLEERQNQQRALSTDVDATSWRQALKPSACAPTLHPTIRHPVVKAQRDVAAETGPKKDNKRKNRDAIPCDEKTRRGKGLASTKESCENGHEGERGESFVCQVVPLSLALHQLGIPVVDLLKVDVEGDELAVLHGIDDEDWPKIHQARMIERGETPRARFISRPKQIPMIYFRCSTFHSFRPSLSTSCDRSYSRCTMSTGD